MSRDWAATSAGAGKNSAAAAAPSAARMLLETRVRQLSVVTELGRLAHAGASLQETMDRAVRAVAQTLNVEYAKILELVGDGSEVFLVAGVGWKEGLVGHAHVSTGLDSQAGYTLASEHPVIVYDMRAETRFSGPELLHAHGVISGVSVIIPGESDRPYGVFGAHTKTQRQFTQEDALFLQAVAHVVAGAVARSRTEEALVNAKTVLERKVAERTRALESAVGELEAFNGMVAHDLREPIRNVTYLAETIAEEHGEQLDDDARALLTKLTGTTARMRHLVDDLLRFADAKQGPLHMEDVDVTALAHERWPRLVQGDAAFERADYIVEEGLTARADPRLLSIVLDNLLANALKFTRGVPRPVVQVGQKHLDVGGTAFFVRDNGAGFPSERRDELFHVFKRLHATATFEGTGVGLATVKRIIERHGGRAWAESDGPGLGATVYFRLLPAGLP